jgi:hypothetical protein
MNINEIIYESIHRVLNEAQRQLSKQQYGIINKMSDDLAREVYQDEYGVEDERTAQRYHLDNYKNDMNLVTGPFAVGNTKLSPDTLIINLTSAFGCPSAKNCPVTQAACYGVAGENRLENTRRKNIKVQKLLARCYNTKNLDKFFAIAHKYIELLKNTKKPIKWVRFNEIGDFPNQAVLDACTEFAKTVAKDGVKCMAYTANGRLNYSEASKVMSINASTNQVLNTFDDSAPKRNFYGVEDKYFSYKFIEDEWKALNKLSKNPKTDTVSETVVNALEVNGTANDITIPILSYGKWGNAEDEQGYYYICPCSFWKDRKNQIEFPYCEEHLNEPPYHIKHLREVYGKDHPIVKALVRQLNKVQSPCGITCAVCHDRHGGIIKGTNEVVKNYAVLNGIHGPTRTNFNAKYAAAKRKGDNTVEWSSTNKNGLWNNNGGVGQYGTTPVPDRIEPEQPVKKNKKKQKN